VETVTHSALNDVKKAKEGGFTIVGGGYGYTIQNIAEQRVGEELRELSFSLREKHRTVIEMRLS